MSAGRSGHRRAVLQVLGWTLLFAALFDAVVNVAFRVPADPRQRPGGLANYFEYGRSVEVKLRRALQEDDAHASGVAVAGWIDRECARDIPAEAGRTMVSFYGMSFSNDVGTELAALDRSVRPVFFAGPAAPPNHSLACFRMQQAHAARSGRDASSVQVLAILASSVKGLLSMTGATTGFEAPAPFTYPRYRLAQGGRLEEVEPLARSSGDWRAIMRDPARWRALREQLAAHDAFYDPWLFEAGLADHSSLLRVLRRAYAQHRSRALADAVLGPHGYREDSEAVPLLKAVVLDFARRSREAGKRPVLLLLQDGTSGDALYRVLAPVLAAQGIEYVSTHAVAPTADPANFIPDGHFTRAANHRIARQLQELLVGKRVREFAAAGGEIPRGAGVAGRRSPEKGKPALDAGFHGSWLPDLGSNQGPTD